MHIKATFFKSALGWAHVGLMCAWHPFYPYQCVFFFFPNFWCDFLFKFHIFFYTKSLKIINVYLCTKFKIENFKLFLREKAEKKRIERQKI